MAKKTDLTPVPCKRLGEKRGRYYITEEIQGLALHLVALVEQRKGFEQTKASRERHAEHIKISRQQSDPVWTELMEKFNAVNTHLGERACLIAYRHFIESTRRNLGYPETVRPPWAL